MRRETGADLTVKRNRRMHPMKEFMEAQLGKPQSAADLGSFLANDRKVLRFECVWDDTHRLYGDVQRFRMHYFLADDTIEILQVHEKNSGRAQAPKLLRRQKLPLPKHQDGVAGGFAEVGTGPQFYHWAHFALGAEITVFNRSLLLVDADPYAAASISISKRDEARPAGLSERRSPRVPDGTRVRARPLRRYTRDHFDQHGRPLGPPATAIAALSSDKLPRTPVPPYGRRVATPLVEIAATPRLRTWIYSVETSILELSCKLRRRTWI